MAKVIITGPGSGVPLNQLQINDITPSFTQLYSSQNVENKLNLKANISGQVFTGNISAPNLNGTNTGDQDLSASNVSYASGFFTSVQQALDSLLYVIPNISGFSITPSVVEIGTTVSSVTLNWVLNKIFTSLSINNGIGAIVPNLLTHAQNVALIANTTFTITGGDGTNTDSENVSLSFRSRRWWGTSDSDTLNNAGILALANNELSTNRQQTRTINGGGQYIWFAFPTSYGVSSFSVNNLPSTAFVTTIISHTNFSGNVQTYYVIRTTTVQNGTLTIQIL